MKKLIILDRDGVINHFCENYVKTPDEWTPIPGSLEAIASLNRKGYLVTVATNQSGIGRNYYTEATLSEIHEKMCSELAQVLGRLEAIQYCPHTPQMLCSCRKPKPGMLKTLIEQCCVKPSETMMVGDSLCDIQAAQAAKCQAVLVKTGRGQQTLTDVNFPNSTPVFETLFDFANHDDLF